jgi:deazaflavin-dependent oxidoreductase (nitroreductase family)
LSFLYLTTKGWKSGKAHEIEIWFVELDSKYYVVSEHRHRSHWVQNIKRDSKVSVRVGEATFVGRARLVDRKTEVELSLKVSKLMDAMFKWSDGLIVELTPIRSVPRAEGQRRRAAGRIR